MDDRLQSSFIPKKPLTAHDAVPSRHAEPPNAIFIATAILFTATMIIAGALFLYQWYLSQTIIDREEQLKNARARFEPAKIEELRRFEKRLNNVNTLVNTHWTSNRFLQDLGDLTLDNVLFTSLGFEFEPPENQDLSDISAGSVNVSLSGLASTYETVALQSRVLEREEYVREANFSNLNLLVEEQDGRVSFEITAVVDPERINYARNVERTRSEMTIESEFEDVSNQDESEDDFDSESTGGAEDVDAEAPASESQTASAADEVDGSSATQTAQDAGDETDSANNPNQ